MFNYDYEFNVLDFILLDFIINNCIIIGMLYIVFF